MNQTSRLARLRRRIEAISEWHRLVPRAASATSRRRTLAVPAGRSSVYLRVRQRNGQIAWASPVFLNWR